ncbi:hypothetical protein [Duganella qianjiadongensis]|uniref:Uncharacterized protein n=1 Tax=Duganella qianjiadongensis TaxID=2692176 RepID=A0ABW9VML0_9BURK|nr:hypothetical protein [Duganella qianjiadongensis]MYM39668.1 hypothetical protein [Duganella qianjiadongensis]
MQRLKEPSTWAGFGILFQALKTLAPHYAPVFDSLSFVAGTVAAAVTEKGAAQA